MRPHELYNLAAMSFVPASWDQPMLTGEFNAQGVTRVLEAIRQVDPSIRVYQASSSEMFGKVREVPQTELTPFYPRSPYGVSKVFAHYITVNYRESYDLFAVSGMLFNHESPRRGLEFVTRKVTDGVARIKLGLADTLSLGNLDAQRDWGFAGDYVRAMWLMLQQDRPDDYVIATGISHSVRELVEVAFGHAGLDWQQAREARPGAASGRRKSSICIGDSSKARAQLGWMPSVDFAALVRDDGRRRPRACRARRPEHSIACRRCESADAIIHEPNDIRRTARSDSRRSRRASASSASATSGCRSPSSSRTPGFDVTGFDVDARKTDQINAGQELHPGRPGRGPRRLGQERQAARDDRHEPAGRDGRDRHLRADAAAQDQGSRPVVRRARRSRRSPPRSGPASS